MLTTKKMARSSCVFVAILFLILGTNYHVRSSPPPLSPPSPSASPSPLPSASSSKITSIDLKDSSLAASSSSSIASTNDESSRKNDNNLPPPSRPQPKSSTSSSSSSVTFLYELYEHEIYNPKTDSWTSRRFTQSPTTGGGGRDSTSLDPQSCAPPRNYLFDGEWKIDMASESRDGFGWEYYVGKYDGLGRRRRRWVRSLRRVSSLSSAAKGAAAAAAAKKRLVDAKKHEKSMASSTKTKAATKTQHHHPGIIRSLHDQYNFKGFGWSFYKSLLMAKSFGAAFRIPLSANFDSYDKYLAAPYISSSTFFGYPWVIATNLNASVPLEAVKWVIGGVLWKIQWGLAVMSALIRGVVEAVLWILFWPLRLWRGTLQVMGILASRGGGGTKKQTEGTTASSLMDSIDEVVLADGDVTRSIIDSGEGTNVTIETHIAIHNNNSTNHKDNGETISALSATAIIDSPRGGASSTTATTKNKKRKHLTISGKEIPTFHRTTSIQYSSTVQERIGMCISWRMSKERGYEYRCHFFYTCLPTLIFWGQLEEERKRRMESLRRLFVGVWGKDPSSAKHVGTIEVDKIHDAEASSSKSLSTSSRSKSQSTKPPILSSFFSEHSSTVGMSSGFPLPVHPHFSLSLLMSLSGFYYGWLWKYMRSLFVLPIPKRLQLKPKNDKELSSSRSSSGVESMDGEDDDDSLSANSEKLVSSALKKKLPVEEIISADNMAKTDDDDDVSLLSNSTQMDVDSDLENCTEELNVAGI